MLHFGRERDKNGERDIGGKEKEGESGRESPAT